LGKRPAKTSRAQAQWGGEKISDGDWKKNWPVRGKPEKKGGGESRFPLLWAGGKKGTGKKKGHRVFNSGGEPGRKKEKKKVTGAKQKGRVDSSGQKGKKKKE